MATLTPVETHAAWTPTIISNDAIVARESKLLLGSRIKTKFRGGLSKGRTYQFPGVSNQESADVGPNGEYTAIGGSESSVSITVDKFKQSAKSWRDDMDAQAILDAYEEYVPKIGYALALAFENDIWALITGITNTAIDPDTDYMEDADILAANLALDEKDVPDGNRTLVLNAANKNMLLLEDKFSDVAFTNKPRGATVTGKLPDIFGLEPVWTNLVPDVTVGADTRHNNLVFHKEWAGAVIQRRVKIRKFINRLAVDVVGSQLYGVGTLRPDHAVSIRTIG